MTFHPATLDSQSPAVQFEELLKALDNLELDLGIVFTRPNSDANGRKIFDLIATYVAGHSNARVFSSLGQVIYLSLMAQVDAVVGNSSSGLYEMPSFKKATVNIGDRQKGRHRAASVIDCAPKAADITCAMREAFTLDCSATVNPYGDGDSAARIKNHLKAIAKPAALLQKHFFDRGGSE